MTLQLDELTTQRNSEAHNIGIFHALETCSADEKFVIE